MNTVRRNPSRRQLRLLEASRRIVVRSDVPMTAEERHAAERKAIDDKWRWQQAYDERTAAARRVQPATRAQLAHLDSVALCLRMSR